MGQVLKVDIKSVKGLEMCPYAGHRNTEHFSETDTCDLCRRIRLCKINCDKSGKLHRECTDCIIKEQNLNDVLNNLSRLNLYR
jgi:hypothetical protein